MGRVFIVARVLTSGKNEIPKGNWNTGNEVEDMPRNLLESRKGQRFTFGCCTFADNKKRAERNSSKTSMNKVFAAE